MLIPASPRIWKTLAATPGWLRIPAPMIETLPICSSVEDRLGDVEPLERLDRGAEIVAAEGEREVRLLVRAHRLVLDDHVDVDVRLGERAEDRGGDAGLVADAGERHPSLLARVRHGCHQGSFHRLVLAEDEGTGAVLERASAVDLDVVVAGVLDRAQLQDLGAGGGHLEHLLEGDDAQLPSRLDDPRVGAEDAGDVGVDLADLGAERRRDRDRGRVRASTPERGHVPARSRDPLEAGDENDPVLGQRVADAVGADVDDPRLGVGGVGDDPRLRAGQRDRVVAAVVDRHRAERARDPLADREQHVHLPRFRAVGDLLRHRDQLVGRLATG